MGPFREGIPLILKGVLCMKRFFAFLLTLSLLAGMLGAPAYAAEELSGTCGDGLTWQIADNTLVISGTGAMYDYTADSPAPWLAHKLNFSRVIVQEGVTSIGSYAFFSLIGTYKIAASVKKVGACAFRNDRSSGSHCVFFGTAPEIAEDAFSGWMTRVYILPHWEQAARQNYGGSLTWRVMELKLADSSKALYGLDEQLLPADMAFYCTAEGLVFDVDCVPQAVTFGPYDNSSYGQKTVTVQADGFEFVHTYYVTDGQKHLELVEVEIGRDPIYAAAHDPIRVTVRAGSLTLKEGRDYTLTKAVSPTLGTDGTVRVEGKGNYAGFTGTYPYPVVRRPVSDLDIRVDDGYFIGYYTEPEVTVNLSGVSVVENTDYVLVYDNNIDPGTGRVRVIGKGRFYGVVEREFPIVTGPTELTLPGNYLGQYDGELSDNIAYNEIYVAPGKLHVKTDCYSTHLAAYALYKLEGEEMVLVEQHTTPAAGRDLTGYEYDFSSIYEGLEEDSGEIYMLSYSWATADGRVYGGAVLMVVPSRVSRATAMVIMQVDEDGDYRTDHLVAYGQDGALDGVTWTSSDPATATVEGGTVRWKKPGTVTVTASSGALSATRELSLAVQPLSGATLFDYTPAHKARVYYDDRLLEEGTDYTLAVTEEAGQYQVTVTGCGLFAGQLVRSFDKTTGEGAAHTHTYAAACDKTCTGCGEARQTGHTYDGWGKDVSHHWQQCLVCGEKTEPAVHSPSADGENVCAVCGPLYTPGDIDGNGEVNRDDVIALLLHVSMPDSFNIHADADFNRDSAVTRDDVITLLLHVSMPGAFPLYPDAQ